MALFNCCCDDSGDVPTEIDITKPFPKSPLASSSSTSRKGQLPRLVPNSPPPVGSFGDDSARSLTFGISGARVSFTGKRMRVRNPAVFGNNSNGAGAGSRSGGKDVLGVVNINGKMVTVHSNESRPRVPLPSRNASSTSSKQPSEGLSTASFGTKSHLSTPLINKFGEIDPFGEEMDRTADVDTPRNVPKSVQRFDKVPTFGPTGSNLDSFDVPNVPNVPKVCTDSGKERRMSTQKADDFYDELSISSPSLLTETDSQWGRTHREGGVDRDSGINNTATSNGNGEAQTNGLNRPIRGLYDDLEIDGRGTNTNISMYPLAQTPRNGALSSSTMNIAHPLGRSGVGNSPKFDTLLTETELKILNSPLFDGGLKESLGAETFARTGVVLGTYHSRLTHQSAPRSASNTRLCVSPERTREGGLGTGTGTASRTSPSPSSPSHEAQTQSAVKLVPKWEDSEMDSLSVHDVDNDIGQTTGQEGDEEEDLFLLQAAASSPSRVTFVSPSMDNDKLTSVIQIPPTAFSTPTAPVEDVLAPPSSLALDLSSLYDIIIRHCDDYDISKAYNALEKAQRLIAVQADKLALKLDIDNKRWHKFILWGPSGAHLVTPDQIMDPKNVRLDTNFSEIESDLVDTLPNGGVLGGGAALSFASLPILIHHNTPIDLLSRCPTINNGINYIVHPSSLLTVSIVDSSSRHSADDEDASVCAKWLNILYNDLRTHKVKHLWLMLQTHKSLLSYVYSTDTSDWDSAIVKLNNGNGKSKKSAKPVGIDVDHAQARWKSIAGGVIFTAIEGIVQGDFEQIFSICYGVEHHDQWIPYLSKVSQLYPFGSGDHWPRNTINIKYTFSLPWPFSDRAMNVSGDIIVSGGKLYVPVYSIDTDFDNYTYFPLNDYKNKKEIAFDVPIMIIEADFLNATTCKARLACLVDCKLRHFPRKIQEAMAKHFIQTAFTKINDLVRDFDASPFPRVLQQNYSVMKDVLSRLDI